VFRAKPILMLADGASFAVFSERLQTTNGFSLEAAVPGRGLGSPGNVSSWTQAVVLTRAAGEDPAATRRKLKDGSSH
jgi:hypothetical protein